MLGHIFTEESHLITNTILKYCKYLTNSKILHYKNDATKYKLCGNEGHYVVQISKPGNNKTSGDLEILDVNKKLVEFIEYTKCRFEASGNNVQFQRMTKFVPYINTDVMCKYFINNDGETKKLKPRDENAIRCMKTIGIQLVITDSNIKEQATQLLPYYSLEEFIQDWNYRSKSKISIHGKRIYISNIHVLKRNKVNSDPEIGKLICVILTILQLRVCSIVIINSGITNEHFSTKNKLFRSIKHIQNMFKNNIHFENTNISYKNCINYQLRCFSGPSESESVVSIAYEGKLKKNKNEILYTNHARGEQSYLKYGGKEYNVPKEILKPDIIHTKGNTVFLVEAEKYDNLNNGIKQIKSWDTNKKTKQFYKEIFKGKKICSYIILYSHKRFDTSDFYSPQFKKVKYVMDKNRNWFSN